MRLPFGLDLKSVLVGALIAYFAVPWVLGMVASRRQPASAA